ARPSKASPPAAALARAGEVSLQNPARPTAVEASPPFSSGTKRPRQDARRSNSDRRRRPSAESGHAESFDRSLSVSSQRFEVPCALDPSGALCKFSAWHTSLCHAGSPIRRNLPTRHFSRDRALGFRADFRLCFDFIDSRKRKLSPFICTKFLGTHLRLGKSRWTEVSLGVSTTSRRSASWYSKPLIYPGQWCLAESSTVILRENRRGVGGTRRGVGLCRSV